jgi:hypothetical protein
MGKRMSNKQEEDNFLNNKAYEILTGQSVFNIKTSDWDKEQEFEKKWWGNCTNTYNEETKQITYATHMGLVPTEINGQYPWYNAYGCSVIDIGGGPTSMLLKTINAPKRMVIDPCPYPEWVEDRYGAAGIYWFQAPGEEDLKLSYDEVWIYNCLQHTQDPEKIIYNAKQYAKETIRIFEWIDVPAHEGHPHELTEADLNKWIGGVGSKGWVNENNCVGMAYYGEFSF